MLSNIFTKTLYERRWSTLVWTLSIGIMTFLIMMLFPTIRDSFGASLKDVPESMQNILGSAEAYQTMSGYIEFMIIMQMIFFTVIMAIITGTSLIAGEESNGTLQTLLAQPVRRSSVYVHKLAALVVMTAVITLGMLAGTLAGIVALGESAELLNITLAYLMVWLVTFLFGALAYAIGALTGKKGVAGIVAGAYAFVAYMLTALAEAAAGLDKLNYASPFYYLNNPSVIKDGIDIGNVLILLGAAVVMVAIGLLAFKRRDIYQR